MANTDKNIVITPNIGSTSDPKIVFSGADASTAAQNITLTTYPLSSGTLSFDGSAGQLFSITNSLSGTIFSVNDVSGIPSIEVLDTGAIKLAQYGGNVGIGLVPSGTYKLEVNGGVYATSITGLTTALSVGQGGTGAITASAALTSLGAYAASNPSGYTSNTGTVTSVSGSGTVSGLSLSGTVTTTGNLTLAGTLALGSLNTLGTAGGLSATLVVGSGGTGISTAPTAGGVVWGATTSTQGYTAVGTTGQLLSSNGTSAPTFITPTLLNIPGAWTKKAVDCATTAALTINTAQTAIDGVTISSTSRVLVKNQTLPAQNGIYTGMTTTTWVRDTDAGTAGNVAGATVSVDAGTANGGQIWSTTYKAADVLGTASMTWYRIMDTSYTVPVANGGTGITTAPTAGGVVWGATTSTQGYTAVGTAGQVLISAATSVPTWSSSIALTGSITTTGGIGYATGAGGTVTQATSRTTGVSLSKYTGQITLFAATLAAATSVAFTLTNTLIAATDVVIINHISGGTLGLYNFAVTPAAGSATITMRNNSATISASEAPVLQFVVVKAVTA